MKKFTQKAFTLVELIVVITILAILATVAFMSFGGQTSKAKNSKVVSDLSNIGSKVNLLSLEDSTIVKKTLDTTTEATSINKIVGGMIPVVQTGATVLIIDDGSINDNYGAGNINFFELKEKKENFQDTTGDTTKDYVYAYLAEGDVNVFNVGGQTKDEAGAYTAIIKGTYYQGASTDVVSLISASGSLNTTPVLNGSLNQLY